MAEEDHDTGEARDVLARIILVLGTVLREHSPLSEPEVVSRWNGEAELEEFAFHAGVIRPDGKIGLLRVVWEQKGAVRYRTLIHEALHSFSHPYTIHEYRDYIGWEEGVVEALQRLLRQEVLGRIGISVAEESFLPIDRVHPFNIYIAELEKLRQETDLSPEAFFIPLLLSPLPQRLNLVLRWRALAAPGVREAFDRQALVANARLRRPFHE